MLNNRQEVIDAVKTSIFPYTDGFQIKEESEESEESEEESDDDVKKIIEYIENGSKGINYDLLKYYFLGPSALEKQVFETKSKNKNNKLVNVIKSGLSGLTNEVEKISEDEKETEKLDKLLKIVEEILEVNRQQRGSGLKILAPNQMLSRLPITLAELKAGNNS